jgi:hypothetical protein
MTTYTITDASGLPTPARVDLDTGHAIVCRFVGKDARDTHATVLYLCGEGSDQRNTLDGAMAGEVLREETRQAALHAVNRTPVPPPVPAVIPPVVVEYPSPLACLMARRLLLGVPLPDGVVFTITRCTDPELESAELHITVTPA